jgi:hypothetical protein
MVSAHHDRKAARTPWTVTPILSLLKTIAIAIVVSGLRGRSLAKA